MQFLLINLDHASEGPGATLRDLGDVLGLRESTSAVLRFHSWLEFETNWKLLGQCLADGEVTDEDTYGSWIATRGAGPGDGAYAAAWLFPNLVLMVAGRETCALVLQPTAMGRTLCRMSVYSEEASPRRPWAAHVLERAAAAKAKHADLARWYTAAAPSTRGKDMPLQEDAVGAWMQRELARRITCEIEMKPVQHDLTKDSHAVIPV